MKRLSLETWRDIIRNLSEEGEEVEIIWLDSRDECGLCYDYELFEDGFKDEYEAEKRLNDIFRELERSN